MHFPFDCLFVCLFFGLALSFQKTTVVIEKYYITENFTQFGKTEETHGCIRSPSDAASTRLETSPLMDP